MPRTEEQEETLTHVTAASAIYLAQLGQKERARLALAVEMVRARQQGLSFREIAKAAGLNEGTAWHLIREGQGIAEPNRAPKRKTLKRRTLEEQAK